MDGHRPEAGYRNPRLWKHSANDGDSSRLHQVEVEPDSIAERQRHLRRHQAASRPAHVPGREEPGVRLEVFCALR